ncbi:hypothetical protein GCM10022280_02730 [Sphingomonas swuensis]|uniref:Secreted protein n=1 Tax=Sphingomonas swuensis TaxID=977800 RepID=A0ABP7SBM1_9SPHN
MVIATEPWALASGAGMVCAAPGKHAAAANKPTNIRMRPTPTPLGAESVTLSHGRQPACEGGQKSKLARAWTLSTP